MISDLETLIVSHIRGKKKKTNLKWLSFNAVCCHHRGERQDTKLRAGLIVSPTSIVYHCFNCKFRTGYEIGGHFGSKMRQLLAWFGVSDEAISTLVFESLRVRNEGTYVEQRRIESLQAFKDVPLPEGTMSLAEWADYGCDDKEFKAAVQYVIERGYDWRDTRFMWNPEKFKGALSKRVLIPFTYHGRNVGWTARAVLKTLQPKYLSNVVPNYVYGLDAQLDTWTRMILMEGPLDAIAINGVALLGSEINDHKFKLIESYGRDVIVVPDYDHSGKQLLEQAITRGWAVSLPPWDVNDVSEATKKYGRLNTLKIITDNIFRSELKIMLEWKRNDKKRRRRKD